MARTKNARNSAELLAEIKKYSDGTKTITQVCRQVRSSHCWTKRLILKHNIPYFTLNKKLTDVQRHLIRNEATQDKTVKYLARKFDATYYNVKKFCDEEQLPYRSYAKEKTMESKFFCWEMYNFNVY
jgi:hypothetical protein